MTITTQTHVQQLVSQIEAATATVAAAIEACSDEEWRIVIGNEGRSVGVVFHHITYAYPFVVDWALKLAAGEGLPAVSYDDIHALNHQHAEAHAAVDQATTLAELQANGAAAVRELGQLSDEVLAVSTPFALIGGQAITVQQVVEWFLINHAHNHLSAINETLETE
jgi:uncharacterized damage-inducible protein DinB